MASHKVNIPWRDIKSYHDKIEQNAPKVSGFPGYRKASDRWAWVTEEDPNGTGYDRLVVAVWDSSRYLGNVVLQARLSVLTPILDRPPELAKKAPGIEKTFSYGFSYFDSPRLYTYTRPRNDITTYEPPQRGGHIMVTREQLVPTKIDVEEFLVCMQIGASGQNRVTE